MHPLNPAKTENILVLGAGELGMAVLRELAARPEARVAVMLRPSAIDTLSAHKRQTLEELDTLDIEVLPGDAVNDSIDQLAAWFSGFDTRISCLGFVAGTGTQLKLAHAALRSHVQHYVPWQFGVDYDVIGQGSPQDLFDEQLEVRQLLRAQSRLDWLIISTGMFTSFLFERAFGVVDLAVAPDDPTRKYRTVFAQGKGVAWDKAHSYNAEGQIYTTTVAEWIERHLL